MQRRLGAAWPALRTALDAPAPTSVRLHRNKGSLSALPAAADGRVPWHARGHYLAERPSFTLDPAFHAGAYYVQEAASMFVAEAFRRLRPLLGDGPLRVLDMCAAPGGKTTALLDELSATDLLVANEVIQNRAGILRYNLTKWGRANVAVSNHDPKDFAGLTGFFDLVLIDAPCSGEGLFRRDPAARAHWSPAAVQHCALRQQRILADTLPLLRPGGIVLYSTCTYNADENERQIAALVDTGYLPLPLALPPEWGVESRRYGHQFYPHRTRSEGFYLAAAQKTTGESYIFDKSRELAKLNRVGRSGREALNRFLPEQEGFFESGEGQLRYLPPAHAANWRALDRHLRRKAFGLKIGALKHEQLVPNAALALAVDLPTTFTDAAVDRTTALAYLRGEAIQLPAIAPGWVRICYGELGLGWAKVLPRRVNNYYPKGWRIRMR